MIKEVHINLNCIQPLVDIRIDIQVDAKFLLHNGICNEDNLKSYLVNNKLNNNLLNTIIYSNNKDHICTIEDIIEEFQQGQKIKNYNSHSAFFNNGYLLDSSEKLVKIKGISFKYNVSYSNIINNFTIDYSKTVRAILKDVKTGNIKFLHNNTEL